MIFLSQKKVSSSTNHPLLSFFYVVNIFLLLIPELIFYIYIIHSFTLLLAVLVLLQLFFYFRINYSLLVSLINIFLTRLSVCANDFATEKKFVWTTKKWIKDRIMTVVKMEFEFSLATTKANDSSLVSTCKLIINHFECGKGTALDFNCFFKALFFTLMSIMTKKNESNVDDDNDKEAWIGYVCQQS